MPRSNFVRQSDLKADEFRAGIVYAETMQKVPRSETIRHSGMSQGNFYKCWKDPALFRVGQLMQIYDFLKIPQSERRFG